MSVARAREVRDRLRALGFTVHEWSGWESRGNGQSSAYEGAIWHHTASNYGSAYGTLVFGRSDLPGPLCNFSGNADGSFTLIAAHPGNHAGASGGYGTWPLPSTSTFNRRVMGLEIVYPGNQPMTNAQYTGLLAWGKVTTDVFGYGDINRVKGHRETSITGKWDPGYAPGKTIDLNAARAAAANFTGGGGSTPPAPEPRHITEDQMATLPPTNGEFRSVTLGVPTMSNGLVLGIGWTPLELTHVKFFGLDGAELGAKGAYTVAAAKPYSATVPNGTVTVEIAYSIAGAEHSAGVAFRTDF
jgi:hypothetical protein